MEGAAEHFTEFYERYWITAELIVSKLPKETDLRNVLGTVDPDD